MPATLTFEAPRAPTAVAAGGAAFVVGSKAAVVSALRDAGSAALLAAAESLSPTPYAPAVVTTFVEPSGGGAPAKYTLAAVPTAMSRHNTPTNSHGVTKAAWGAVGGAPRTDVFAVLDDKAHAMAVAAAVARALPLYSTKTAGAVGSSGAASGGAGGSGGDDRASPVVSMSFICDGAADIDLSRCSIVADRVRHAAALVDMPCSYLHTDKFVEIATTTCAEIGAEAPIVISGRELEERGFGGIWGVGKAATHLPALVHLKYVPEGGATAGAEPVCFLGKGIVYDTGGLSIKGKTFMPGMKRDCGGAAAVFNAWVAAVQLKLKRELHCILALAENAVGPEATRPDDIHTFYSGRTVEINNTDAEGRLVLGDAVAYATRDIPSATTLIDMATLTGAQGIATGKRHGAVYTNSEAIERLVVEAGRSSGDLCHPLPFAPEFYFPEFKSAVADMKNSVADRANAQSSCAGQFIGEHLCNGFIEKGTWLHIDMAYPAFSGERATGYGVALLIDLLDRL